MQALFESYMLYLHILAGVTALVAGLISIVVQKGKKWHRKSGKLYFMAMTSCVHYRSVCSGSARE